MKDIISTIGDQVSLRTGRAVKQQREETPFGLRMLAVWIGVEGWPPAVWCYLTDKARFLGIRVDETSAFNIDPPSERPSRCFD
jgi:hypothetical protein